MRLLAISFAVLMPLSLATGCSETARECSVGGDCPSGACLASGTCAPLGDGGAGDDARSGDGGQSIGDGGAACVPSNDRVISRNEITLGAGLSAPFRVASDTPVSTAGTSRLDGTRAWTLVGPLSGDHDVTAMTLPMTGQWFAATFPTATYAAKLRDSEALLGIFRVTPEALLLLGVASPAAGFQRTEMTYDPPVTVLKFPLMAGTAFDTTATVTGTFNGTPFTTYQERYQSDVDAVGDMTTPYGSFPVVRVRTVLTRTVGLLTTVIRTYVFVSECYGAVATIVSADNETSIEFTQAKEARRLVP